MSVFFVCFRLKSMGSCLIFLLPIVGAFSSNAQDIVRGDALTFDGGNDYASLSGIPIAMDGMTTFTCEGWFKSSSSQAGQDVLIGVNTSTGGNVLLITVRSGALDIFDGTSGAYEISSTNIVDNDEWHHFAYVGNGGIGTLYINGVEEATHTINYSFAATNEWSIGMERDGGAASDFYLGEIDEVRIWSVARSADEIRENMHLTLDNTTPGLESYYQFNDGTGATTLTDNSANSNTGTLVNMDATTDWIASGVNVGNDILGNSSSITLTGVPTGASTQNFTTANMQVVFTAHSALESFTATYQAFSPNALIGVSSLNIISDTLWTLNKSTNNSTQTANITFTLPSGGLNAAVDYALYNRAMYSDGVWTSLPNVGTVLSANQIRFDGVSVTGQFLIAEGSPEINLVGNAISILDGDVTPDVSDSTQFEDVNVSCGSPKTVTFEIENTGVSVLNITNATSSSGDFVIGGMTLPLSVASGATETFTVTFTPSAMGTVSSIITLINNDLDEGTYTFTVEGTGFAATSDITRGDLLSFDGVNDYVDVSSLASTMAGVTDFTLEGWFKADVQLGTKGAIFAINDNSTGNNVLFISIGQNTADDRLNVFDGVSNAYEITSVNTVTNNEWHHWAYVKENTTGTLYINGVVEATHTTNYVLSATNRWSIAQDFDGAGSPFPTDFYLGLQDEVRVWSVARTAFDIRENMHLTLDACVPGLEAYYQFNDGVGSTVLADRTGNGHDGSLVSMDVATDWMAGGVNVGHDATPNSNSVSIANVAAGVSNQDFTTANLEIDFTAHSATEDFTTTFQEFAPNTLSGVSAGPIISVPMWTVNKSTNTSTQTMDLTFTVPSGGLDGTTCLNYLFYREMYEDGPWTQLTPLGTVLSPTQIMFSGINVTGQFLIACDNTALPVELIDFTATASEDKVLLHWTTLSERNNDYFAIERSRDGIQFETIMIVDGAGNSSIPITYAEVDTEPVVDALSYYRLKQIDFDGTVSYSGVRSVFLTRKEEVLIYPNPVQDDLHVSLHSSQLGMHQLQIFDMLGRLRYESSFQKTKDALWPVVNVESMAPGIYSLRMTLPDGTSITSNFTMQ